MGGVAVHRRQAPLVDLVVETIAEIVGRLLWEVPAIHRSSVHLWAEDLHE